MRNILKKSLEVLFPAQCTTCKNDLAKGYDRPVCQKCLGKIVYLNNKYHTNHPFLDELYSVARYEGVMKEMIHAFKYQGKDYLSGILADTVTRFWQAERKEIQCLIPVPMPYWREVRRGYNQAQLLARRFSARWSIPWDGQWLKRLSRMPSQTVLNRQQRILNAGLSFQLRTQDQPFPYKKVMLIDDIYTTGATLNACARLLKRAGAKEVGALTVAREI